ncbi:proline dehydrogenase family protein [Egicoccus halophilus]|uniref:proline dehydrogenase n=1 Tax=Egicoccus halophilus TaxID=1670830 RepID=A0A8J3ETJ5_9ACTN|nr:proline dehydrogenase family protein [Egicoccus halophilus]GGI09767.1 proline dehydrogenase [Egicoccus halophilus]
MLRWLLSRAAGDPRLAELAATSPLVRPLVDRFVAGDTLEDGLRAATELAAVGATLTLDHVGEYVTDEQDADAAAGAYRDLLARSAEEQLPAGISVKPTQLGLLLDRPGCKARVADLAARAAEADAHVTLDMEDHTVTEATVRLVEQAHADGATNVGCALQSALHRTPEDVRRLTRLGAGIRLCKGAYAEPAHVAWQRRVEVDRAYLEAARYLLREATYPRFATHDHRLVAAIKREAAVLGRARDSYEFQMLYGVRDDLQRTLVGDGYRLCVYVPYGTEWFPYVVRRLAERPANLAFFLRALTSGDQS